MKATIYLSEENHNPINLDGTLAELLQGSDGLTVVMSGGENNKNLRAFLLRYVKRKKQK